MGVEIKYINEEIADVEKRIRKMTIENEDAKLIMTIKGFDTFAASLIALEIDDIKRFKRPKQLVSWAGLCPTVHQSGNTLYHGKMKKDSNGRINWIMIQAAFVAMRYDSRMKQVYERARKSHPSMVAISHVAQKLLTIIWHMLKNKTEYDGKDNALYARKLKKMASQ